MRVYCSAVCVAVCVAVLQEKEKEKDRSFCLVYKGLFPDTVVHNAIFPHVQGGKDPWDALSCSQKSH